MKLGNSGKSWALGRYGNPVPPIPPADTRTVIRLQSSSELVWSADLREAALERSTITDNRTQLGQREKTLIAKDSSSRLTVKGFFNEVSDALILAALQTISGFTFAPSGESTGHVSYAGDAVLTDYKVISEVDGLTEIEASLDTTGEIDRTTSI
jgi:hypothetical protein